MLKPETITALQTFESPDAPVLSVYLDLDPARQIQRSYRAVFDDMVRAWHSRLGAEAREPIEREAQRVRAWLAQAEPRGRGLVIFACTPHGLWEAHFLPVAVRDHLAFEPRPDIAPLLEILDEHERYAVALVDKERARLYTVFLGEIEESDAFRDLVPGKHDQGGWSQARYQRHHEAHVYWHLKHVVERLTELYRRRQFDRLILAGPDEATSQLRRLLPRPLSQRLVAVIPGELFASEAAILAKTAEIEQQAERDHEARLVGELFEAGAERVALGPAATLDAAWLGAVQLLVVAEGVHLPGSVCPQCGRLQTSALSCAACGSPTHPVHDLVERLMVHVTEHAGAVEVVHGPAAEQLREQAQGLGALLRFPV